MQAIFKCHITRLAVLCLNKYLRIECKMIFSKVVLPRIIQPNKGNIIKGFDPFNYYLGESLVRNVTQVNRSKLG